jgi:ABC-type Fe3+/spermidine/putrescine transport system ATPase subunit
MAFIAIKGLTKNFGLFRALSGVDITIEEKEFVTFLGPSGCGKTTTLRLLAGFLRPDAGTISVRGEVVSSPDAVVPPEQRRMGMVFQNYAVWPHMSVLENVAFGLRYTRIERKDHRTRIDQVLAAVGLEGLEHRQPAQLSGGQQQRVALARSLIVEPSILLLDEPLSNLDAKLRERMRSELKNLQRRTGITFVYVTHDQTEAMALSDRIAVFHQGAVQQVGPPRTVYERPANLFVADFMGQVNSLRGTVVSREDGKAIVAVGPHRLVAVDQTGKVAQAGIVTIRPEALVVATGPSAPGDNQFKGTVIEAGFLGSVIDYHVDVGGAVLRVQADRRSFREVGSEVVLTVPTSECALMDDTPATNADEA